MKLMKQKILVVQNKTSTTTEGGLVLPDQTVQLLPSGVIAAAGPDCKTVKVGDRVLLNDIGGIFVTISNQQYLSIDEEDVIVVLEGDEV